MKFLDETDLALRKRINLVRNNLTPRIELIENQNSDFSNVYVNLSEEQVISGKKTFTISPIVPNIDISDTSASLNNNIINKKYCDDKISNLVNSAPNALDTLNELSIALNNDSNFAATVTNLIGLKAPLESPVLTGTPTAPTALQGNNSTQIATTEYVDNGLLGKVTLTDVQTSNNVWTGTNTFDTILPTSTVTPSNSNDLTTKSYVDNNFSTISQLNTKAADTSVVHLIGAETITGSKTFTNNTQFSDGINVTSGTLTLPTASISSSSINNTSFVDLSNTQTIAGTKTFTNNTKFSDGINVTSGTLTLPTASISSSSINNTLFVDLSNTQTIAGSKTFTNNTQFSNGINVTSGTLTLPTASISSSSINNTSFVDLSNTQTIAGSKTFTNNTQFSNGINVTSGTLTFPTASISSSSINNTSFVDLSNTQTISGSKTFTGLLTTSGGITINNPSNSKQLQIKPGYNLSTLSPNFITYDAGSGNTDNHLFNGFIYCNSLISTNGCTLGNGNDLSVVKRNLNIDNVLRVGYGDTTDVGPNLSNGANLDVKGNIYVSGTINSSNGVYATQNSVTTLMSSYGSLTGTNTWSGTNTFDTLPTSTSTLTPSLGTHLITKNFSDSTYQSKTSMSSYLTNTSASTTYGSLTGNNVWTGTNQINELRVNKVLELSSELIPTNTITTSYSSSSINIYTLTPSSSSNMVFSITNSLPSITGFVSYTFNIDTFTYTTFIKTLSVNSSSVPIYFNGGLTNIDISTSIRVIQNINIYVSSGVVQYALSSVSSFS